MPKLGKLNLQLALKASRSLRENIKYQSRTVQHTTLQFAFKVTFLARTQGRTGDHQLSIVLPNERLELIQLAFAYEITGVGAFS